jgi:uncharacterized protein (DUF1684 family)
MVGRASARDPSTGSGLQAFFARCHFSFILSTHNGAFFHTVSKLTLSQITPSYMKYFIAFLFILSIGRYSFAQSHKEQITAFRQNYKDDFLKDPRSPLKKEDLEFLRFYDTDSTYRITAKAELLTNQPAFIIPTFSGSGSQYVRYALLSFMLKGKPMQLTIYKSIALSQNPAFGSYLFLPFTDATNGSETYGGGRYIDLTTKDIKNGSIIIDFNKAYNPYCAFSSGYSCPKPPDENRVDMAVEAGEKNFGKGH